MRGILPPRRQPPPLRRIRGPHGPEVPAKYGYHRYLWDLICGAVGLYVIIKLAPSILWVVMDMLNEILVNAFTGG